MKEIDIFKSIINILNDETQAPIIEKALTIFGSCDENIVIKCFTWLVDNSVDNKSQFLENCIDLGLNIISIIHKIDFKLLPELITSLKNDIIIKEIKNIIYFVLENKIYWYYFSENIIMKEFDQDITKLFNITGMIVDGRVELLDIDYDKQFTYIILNIRSINKIPETYIKEISKYLSISLLYSTIIETEYLDIKLILTESILLDNNQIINKLNNNQIINIIQILLNLNQYSEQIFNILIATIRKHNDISIQILMMYFDKIVSSNYLQSILNHLHHDKIDNSTLFKLFEQNNIIQYLTNEHILTWILEKIGSINNLNLNEIKTLTLFLKDNIDNEKDGFLVLNLFYYLFGYNNDVRQANYLFNDQEFKAIINGCIKRLLALIENNQAHLAKIIQYYDCILHQIVLIQNLIKDTTNQDEIENNHFEITDNKLTLSNFPLLKQLIINLIRRLDFHDSEYLTRIIILTIKLINNMYIDIKWLYFENNWNEINQSWILLQCLNSLRNISPEEKLIDRQVYNAINIIRHSGSNFELNGNDLVENKQNTGSFCLSLAIIVQENYLNQIEGKTQTCQDNIKWTNILNIYLDRLIRELILNTNENRKQYQNIIRICFYLLIVTKYEKDQDIILKTQHRLNWLIR